MLAGGLPPSYPVSLAYSLTFFLFLRLPLPGLPQILVCVVISASLYPGKAQCIVPLKPLHLGSLLLSIYFHSEGSRAQRITSQGHSYCAVYFYVPIICLNIVNLTIFEDWIHFFIMVLQLCEHGVIFYSFHHFALSGLDHSLLTINLQFIKKYSRFSS